MPSFPAKSILLSSLSPMSDYDYFAAWCRWIWVTIFSVCLRLLTSTKPVRYDSKNERDWSKEHQEEKARERNGLALNMKITDRSELRQKGTGWGPNYGGQKAKQEVSLYAFYQQVCSLQNKWVGEVLSAVASSALSWFTFSDLSSTLVFQNECLKLHWSSEVILSHRNVNWEVSLRLALSHEGTTYAAACGKAL